MSEGNKHIGRNLLIIGLGILLLILMVMADCDIGIFPSTPQEGSGVAFNRYWGDTFMITPFLEDNKNCWGWTKTGYGSLYDGGGFDRRDACEFMCDARKDCNLFDDCTLFRGNSRECSSCEDDHMTANNLDCTLDSDVDRDGIYPCPGEPHDCYKICKQDAIVGLFYPFKVDLVFVVDTTGSMRDAWVDLCDTMTYIPDKLKDMGVEVEYTIYALDSCSESYHSCIHKKIVPVSGDGNYECESWGDGVEDRAKNHPWRPNAKRIIFPVADEGPHGGCEHTGGDQAAVDRAIQAAKDNDVAVYGLWCNNDPCSLGSGKDNIDFMIEISSATGGSAYYFADKDSLVNAVVSAVTHCPDPFTTIDVDIYSHQWSNYEEYIPPPPDPETRKYCFLEGAVKGVTTFRIPDTSVDDSKQPTAKPIVPDKHIWRIEHPAFNIIETGNMPFEIINPEFEISGDEYRIKRVYKPNPSTSQEEFIVNSDLVFDYTLLESIGGSIADASQFEIDATHSYTSMVLTNTYYVACDHSLCQGNCKCWHIPGCISNGCCKTCRDEPP